LASDQYVGVKLLERLNRVPWFKTAAGPSSTRITIEGREFLNFASNNYLDLANDPRVVAAVHRAVDEWGAGITGSRLLNGSMTLHTELEQELADFYGKPAALVFPTGYTANLGLLSSLIGPGDVVAADKLIHASCLDGLRMSRARTRTFAHNDPADLERLLKADRAPQMCVIEGVYSMHGDMAPVDEIADLCTRYGTMLVVDEAHAVGTVGPTGAGAAEHYGRLDAVDAITVTFSKSLGGCGGAVVGSRELIDCLRYLARPFIYTASNTPGSLAGALEALRILRANPQYVAESRAKAAEFGRLLQDNGVRRNHAQAPVLTVHVGTDVAAVQAWRMLWNRGVYCNAVISPAVPLGEAGVRMSVLRTHDVDDLATAAKVVRQVMEELG
jgi:8-amino-7-oxononanoate synthase